MNEDEYQVDFSYNPVTDRAELSIKNATLTDIDYVLSEEFAERLAADIKENYS